MIFFLLSVHFRRVPLLLSEILLLGSSEWILLLEIKSDDPDVDPGCIVGETDGSKTHKNSKWYAQ